MNCPLCNHPRCVKIAEEKSRRFFHCGACGLIFVPVADRVGTAEEKQRYALHDNAIGNEGYVSYLEEVVAAVRRYARPRDRILDYGSGLHAVLTKLFRRAGFDCTAYDPLYGIGARALPATYDVIVLCEVIEHLRELTDEIGRIGGSLDETGMVVIRTRLYPAVESFAAWWYKNDCTHINFFSETTLDAVAAKLGLRRERCETSDIFVFTSPSRPASSP